MCLIPILVAMLVSGVACNSASRPASRPASTAESREAEPGRSRDEAAGTAVPRTIDPVVPAQDLDERGAEADEDPAPGSAEPGSVAAPQGSTTPQPTKGIRSRSEDDDGWNSPTAPLGRDDEEIPARR